mmetsp:Transcript_19259/g.32147  ORF Transcript_19259/g.32147 Transcript_19259/m.32147 type:complete len:369 (-) Transcript_19259:274-1380(-)
MESCYVENITDIVDCENHVVLCSSAKSPVTRFISTIRQHNDNASKKIVLLCTAPPSPEVWVELGDSEHVYWMLGEACVVHDLLRVGLAHADSIVLLSEYFNTYTPNVFNPTETADQTDVDRYIIRCHRVVAKFLKSRKVHKVRLISHINNPANGVFLEESEWHKMLLSSNVHHSHQKRKSQSSTDSSDSWKKHVFNTADPDLNTEISLKTIAQICDSIWPMLMTESYASGESWSVSCFFFILFSSYVSGSIALVFALLQAILKNAGRGAKEPNTKHGLRLMRVPDPFVGMSYGCLFHHCMNRHQGLCIGMFKGYGHHFTRRENAFKPVVIINPPKGTILNSCDYIYIIGGRRSAVKVEMVDEVVVLHE